MGQALWARRPFGPFPLGRDLWAGPKGREPLGPKGRVPWASPKEPDHLGLCRPGAKCSGLKGRALWASCKGPGPLAGPKGQAQRPNAQSTHRPPPAKRRIWQPMSSSYSVTLKEGDLTKQHTPEYYYWCIKTTSPPLPPKLCCRIIGTNVSFQLCFPWWRCTDSGNSCIRAKGGTA